MWHVGLGVWKQKQQSTYMCTDYGWNHLNIIKCNSRHSKFCVFVLVVTIIFIIVNICNFGSSLPFYFAEQEGLTKFRLERLSEHIEVQYRKGYHHYYAWFQRWPKKWWYDGNDDTKCYFVRHEETWWHTWKILLLVFNFYHSPL